MMSGFTVLSEESSNNTQLCRLLALTPANRLAATLCKPFLAESCLAESPAASTSGCEKRVHSKEYQQTQSLDLLESDSVSLREAA